MRLEFHPQGLAEFEEAARLTILYRLLPPKFKKLTDSSGE